MSSLYNLVSISLLNKKLSFNSLYSNFKLFNLTLCLITIYLAAI